MKYQISPLDSVPVPALYETPFSPKSEPTWIAVAERKKTEFSGEIWQFWNRFPKMPNLAIEFRSFFYIALHLALLLPLVNQFLLIKTAPREFRIYLQNLFVHFRTKNTSDLWVWDRFSWIFEFSFIKKSISVCSLIFFWWYLQWICCFISPDRYVPTADLCSVRPSFNPITTVSHRPHQRAPKHQRNSSINVKITLYMTNSPYLHTYNSINCWSRLNFYSPKK